MSRKIPSQVFYSIFFFDFKNYTGRKANLIREVEILIWDVEQRLKNLISHLNDFRYCEGDLSVQFLNACIKLADSL